MATTGKTFEEYVQRFVRGFPKVHVSTFKEIFKGVNLVQGWKITLTVSKEDAEVKKTIIDTWVVREKHDVQKDLKLFLSDLISSCS